MREFFLSQKFIDLASSALLIDLDGPDAEERLERIEAELDSAISHYRDVSPLHPLALDEYLFLNWVLHVSWTGLRRPDDLPNRTARAAGLEILGKEILASTL